MRDLKMMFRLLRSAAKSQVMYRTDFLIGLIGTLAYNGLFLSSIGIITACFGSIGGFNSAQMVLLYSIFEISHGLFGFFLQNMTAHLNRLVYDGTLDIYLTRPCAVLLQMNGKKMNYMAFIDLFIGIVCFLAVADKAGVTCSILKAFMLPVFILSGMTIEFSLALLMNCGTVISPSLRSLYGTYHQLVLISQRYPLHIFTGALQGLLTFAFPLGFVNYYPTLYLIGYEQGALAYLAPIVAAIFATLAVCAFNHTLKYYCGTGN